MSAYGYEGHSEVWSLLSLLSKPVSFFPAAFWGNVTFFVLLAVRTLLFYKPSSLTPVSLQRIPEAQSQCLTYYVASKTYECKFMALHLMAWLNPPCAHQIPLCQTVYIHASVFAHSWFWRLCPQPTTSKRARMALPILQNANEIPKLFFLPCH